MYPYYSLCTKFNSNIQLSTLNLTEEEVCISVEHSGPGKDLMDRTLIVQVLRSTINKWDHIKPQSFCKAKKFYFQRNKGVLSFTLLTSRCLYGHDIFVLINEPILIHGY